MRQAWGYGMVTARQGSTAEGGTVEWQEVPRRARAREEKGIHGQGLTGKVTHAISDTDHGRNHTAWRPDQRVLPVSPQAAANTLVRILPSAARDRHHFPPLNGTIRVNPDPRPGLPSRRTWDQVSPKLAHSHGTINRDPLIRTYYFELAHPCLVPTRLSVPNGSVCHLPSS